MSKLIHCRCGWWSAEPKKFSLAWHREMHHCTEKEAFKLSDEEPENAQTND